MTNDRNYIPDESAFDVPRVAGCSCQCPSEYNVPENPRADDRHEVYCALTPDLDNWLFYAHDGELEQGGVFVHPTDKSRIFLLVKGYVFPVSLSDEDEDDDECNN
jgi:hypothetical protein